jgi:hypothetical protein
MKRVEIFAVVVFLAKELTKSVMALMTQSMDFELGKLFLLATTVN